MGHISSKQITKIRKSQKRKFFSLYILIALTIILPLGYFLTRERAKDTQGTQVFQETPQIDSPEAIICVDDQLDDSLQAILSAKFPDLLKISPVGSNEDCNIEILRNITDNSRHTSIAKALYALVTRVDNPLRSITHEDLQKALSRGVINDKRILWANEDQSFIQTVNPNAILLQAGDIDKVIGMVKSDPDYLAIIPLAKSDPDLRVENIDGLDPLDAKLYIYDYALLDSVWISSDAQKRFPVITTEIKNVISETYAEKIYDPAFFSSVLLTGRSAVGARQFYDLGSSPLTNISSEIKDADVTFISNESSFTDQCLQQNNSNFLCGKLNSFDWIKDAGVDIISVAGESIIDQGRPAFEDTLALYKRNKIEYVGGGLTRQEALKPISIDISESSISFISSSLITPTRYLATTSLSGNIAADELKGDGKNLREMLQRAENADLRVAEIRWNTPPSGIPSDYQKYYIEIAKQNGADILFGTAEDRIGKIYHQDGFVVFTSLGDFLHEPDTKNDIHGFAVKLHFYKGKFISYEIIPLKIDDSKMLHIADMDTAIKIMNTVYTDTFELL